MATPKEISILFAEINQTDVAFYTHHLHLDKIETSIHTHQKAQLLYAEGGIVHVFVNNRHWYLPARCFMWIPAGVEHSVLSFSKNVDLLNFYFKVDDQDLTFYEETNIYFVSDLLREMFLFTVDWDGPVYENNPVKYDFLKAIKSILPELESNKIPFAIQHPFPKDQKLLEVARFLSKNLDKSYTIEEVAKEFGLSERTLSRKFKEHLGMNYIRFLRSLRITKSLELITEKKYNMLEIALQVGYSSLASFSNIFLKITGIRPTEYARILNK
jgi:AraC-like DNA-binding protein